MGGRAEGKTIIKGRRIGRDRERRCAVGLFKY